MASENIGRGVARFYFLSVLSSQMIQAVLGERLDEISSICGLYSREPEAALNTEENARESDGFLIELTNLLTHALALMNFESMSVHRLSSWLLDREADNGLGKTTELLCSDLEAEEIRNRMRTSLIADFTNWYCDNEIEPTDNAIVDALKLAFRCARELLSITAGLCLERAEGKESLGRQIESVLPLSGIEAVIGVCSKVRLAELRSKFGKTDQESSAEGQANSPWANILSYLVYFEQELMEVKSRRFLYSLEDTRIVKQLDPIDDSELAQSEKVLSLIDCYFWDTLKEFNETRFNSALESIERVLRPNPTLGCLEYYFDWLMCHERLELALTVLDRLVHHRSSTRLSPDPQYECLRGSLLLQLERYDEALTACNEAQRQYDETGTSAGDDFTKLKMAVYRSTGKLEEALNATEGGWYSCDGIDAMEDPGILKSQGNTLAQMGRLDEALEAYERAEGIRDARGLVVDPDFAKNRGNVYMMLGRYYDAIIASRESEKQRADLGLPQDPDLEFNMALIYKAQELFEEALVCYLKAEEIRLVQGLPVDPGVTKNRGNLLSQMKRYDEALLSYDLAEKQRESLGMPVDPEIHFNRAYSYGEMGQLDKACQLAHEAVAMYDRLNGVKVNPQILKWISENCE